MSVRLKIRASWTHALCGGSLLLAMPASVIAQAAPAQDTILSSTLATITTDTGAFAYGHRDFTRYDTPGLCAAAGVTTAQVLRNTLAAIQAADTLRYKRRVDTLPAEAIQVARTCGAKMATRYTTPLGWAELFDWALLTRNDSLARMALTQWLTSVPLADRPEIERRSLRAALGEVTDGGLHAAHPARLDLAQAIVVRMDAVADFNLSMFGHMEMLEYGTAVDDTMLARQAVQGIIELAHRSTMSGYSVGNAGSMLANAFDDEVDLTHYISSEATRLVAQRAHEAFQSFSSDSICARLARCRTASVNEIATYLDRRWGHDTVAPALHAAFWFPPPGVAGPVHVPAMGKITLVVHPDVNCQLIYIWWQDQETCKVVPELIRTWAQRYGGQGVDIVLIGAGWGGGFLSGAESAAQEAERIRWYWQDFLKLPVTVAVQTPRWRTLPAPDNRRISRDVPDANGWYDDAYPDTRLTIIDRQGNRVYRSNIDLDDRGSNDAEIAYLLKLQPATPALPSHTSTGS